MARTRDYRRAERVTCAAAYPGAALAVVDPADGCHWLAGSGNAGLVREGTQLLHGTGGVAPAAGLLEQDL